MNLVILLLDNNSYSTEKRSEGMYIHVSVMATLSGSLTSPAPGFVS